MSGGVRLLGGPLDGLLGGPFDWLFGRASRWAFWAGIKVHESGRAVGSGHA